MYIMEAFALCMIQTELAIVRKKSDITSAKHIILTMQVHGGDMSNHISFIHCSCCKIGDKSYSWLLKELLKENDLFSPSFLCISISEGLRAKTAVHGLLCVTPGSAGCLPATGDPFCSCLGLRMDFFWKRRWPWEDQGFYLFFNCYIDMLCCKSTNLSRQYLKCCKQI